MKTWQARFLAAVLAVAVACSLAYGDEASAAGAKKGEPEAAAPPGKAEPPAAAAGKEAEPDDEKADPPWRLQLSLYAWLSGMSSTVKAHGEETTSDVSFGDLAKALDFASFMRFEAQRGKWGLFAEVDYIKLSGDSDVRTPGIGLPFKTSVDGVTRQTIVELAGIRSFDWERVGVDAFAGGRYFLVKSDMNFGRLESEVSKDWVDPMVGARLRLRLSERWGATLRGDLAGFGVGSELTTNVAGFFTYDISEHFGLGFGYRYMNLDYDGKKVDMSTETYGPVLGVGIRF